MTGFTLVELLIAISLGATLLVATTRLFVETRGSHQYHAEWQGLHERGRHLMQFLSSELKKAGYPKSSFSGFPIDGSNGDGESQSDSLTISYQDGEDCAGSSSTTITYYLDEADVRCNGNGDSSPTPQTLTSGVDGLQIRYGTDIDEDGSIDRYLDADAIDNWDQVHTVELAVLLRSDLAVRQESDQNIYPLLDVDHGPYSDHYLRRIYRQIVHLRNQ